MYLPRPSRGRLAGEMRCRALASIAVLALAGVPAVSIAAEPSGTGTLHVSVKPGTGSQHTRFVVDFRAPEATGTIGSVHRTYRVTASQRKQSGCQTSAAVVPPASKAAANVRVVLSPSNSHGWCTGTFSGTVWEIETFVCPPGEACPALVPAPRNLGTFSFRVTRG
jgi:hypothetical protein